MREGKKERGMCHPCGPACCKTTILGLMGPSEHCAPNLGSSTRSALRSLQKQCLCMSLSLAASAEPGSSDSALLHSASFASPSSETAECLGEMSA